jgi:HicB family
VTATKPPRAIVRIAAREYNRQTVSSQPSASAVDEASRQKAATPSGRLLLRMPPGLHAELARVAEREGASLNGYIIARLTESVGWTPSSEPAAAHRTETPASSTLTRLLMANVAAVGLAAVAAVAILLVAWLS